MAAGKRPLVDLLLRGRWILIDQILSSGTNFVLSFVLVRSVTPREFGAFGVALITYQIVLSLARVQASEPMTIDHSQSDPGWSRAASQSTGFALGLGLAAGLLMVCAGLLLAEGILRVSLVTIGVITPGLLVQDTWRHAFFAQGKPTRAAANDTVLALVQAGALFVAVRTGGVTVVEAILAWGIASLVAAVVGAFQASCLPNLSECLTWAREHRTLSSALTGDLLARGAATHLALFAVGALAGLASIGFVRAGLLLFGPLYALIQGAVPFAVSECVRLRAVSPRRLDSASYLLSLLFGVGGLALGGALLLLPDGIGRSFLGSSWDGTRPLLPAMTALAVAAGVVVGPAVGLRALRSVGRLMGVSLVLAPVTIALAAAGALTHGAEGAAWGLAAANAATAGALMWQFWTANRALQKLPHP